MRKIQSKNKKILAIIPARGGSERVPRKNIKLLSDKPLIAYTIEAALKSKYLDRTVVSTDDKEIARISKKYGAEIIKRPKKLAEDHITKEQVTEHTVRYLKRYKNYKPDIIIYLQPTAPFRNTDDIDNAVSLFLENKAKSLVSVSEYSPYWCLKIEKKYLRPFFSWKYFKMRSQDLPKSYIPNGAIFISTPQVLQKYKSFYCNPILPYIMPKERSIDIDSQLDLMLAEEIIKNAKN